MGKKFMVVKPKYCCGDTVNVGRVFESVGFTPEGTEVYCMACKDLRKPASCVRTPYKGVIASVEESRIVWLPDLDEDKELETIKELEKEKVS